MLDLNRHGIFGNGYGFEEIYTWIERMTSCKMQSMCQSACLIVTGAPGIGKTYGIETICKILEIKIKKIDSSNCHSTKELIDLLTKMTTTSLEEQLLQQDTKKIIFIDEFEIMLGIDRNMPSTLCQLVGCDSKTDKRLPYMPIIIACNSNIEKKLGDIKRLYRLVHLRTPTDADIILMLREHVRRTNIHVSADILVSISERAAGNMMQAIKMLGYEILSMKSKKDDDVTQHVGIDKMPDIDILYNSPNRDIAVMLIEEDIWMNPLRFHENLPLELDKRKGTKSQKGSAYSKMLMCMIEWDVMLSHMGTDNTNVHNIATEHLCRAPCSILPSLPGKKNAKESSMVGFTKTLSQMSLQSKMEKQTYNDGFPWKHVGGYSYMLKKTKKKKFSTLDTDSIS